MRVESSYLSRFSPFSTIFCRKPRLLTFYSKPTISPISLFLTSWGRVPLRPFDYNDFLCPVFIVAITLLLQFFQLSANPFIDVYYCLERGNSCNAFDCVGLHLLLSRYPSMRVKRGRKICNHYRPVLRLRLDGCTYRQ